MKNIKAEIKKLERELNAESEKNGLSKRAVFLMATINVNRKQVGLAPKYEW